MRHKNPLHLIVAHIKIAGSNKKTQGFSPFLFKHVFYCWENWKWIKVFVYVFFNIHAVSLEQRTNHKRISDIKYQTLQIAPSQFNFEDGGDFSKGNNIYICYISPLDPLPYRKLICDKRSNNARLLCQFVLLLSIHIIYFLTYRVYKYCKEISPSVYITIFYYLFFFEEG